MSPLPVSPPFAWYSPPSLPHLHPPPYLLGLIAGGASPRNQHVPGTGSSRRGEEEGQGEGQKAEGNGVHDREALFPCRWPVFSGFLHGWRKRRR